MLNQLREVIDNLSGSDIYEFVSSNPGNINITFPTLGGEVFWDTVYCDGWKIQRNTNFGNCRILDSSNNRKAWGNESTIIMPLINIAKKKAEAKNKACQTGNSSQIVPNSLEAKLKEAKSLFDRGIITEDEYQQRRKMLLMS